MAKLRVFFASDIHGSEKCFLKFINAGKFYKANVIILSGDITGKMIVPIVKQKDGTYEVRHVADLTVKTKEELDEVEKNIRSSGYYVYLTNEEEMRELIADKGKVEKLFSSIMLETLNRWIHIAEERLKGTGIKCFISPGNDDRYEIDNILKNSDYVVNPHETIVEINSFHEMISLGYSNITPWKCPRDITEEELSSKIDSLIAKVNNIKNCIFNFHCPPYGTRLDVAPEIDQDLRPIVVGGRPHMIHAGSVAIRRAIEKYQPLLGLHGHIHESRGVEKIGRTLCINPGSEYERGTLRGALLDVSDKGIEDYALTVG